MKKCLNIAHRGFSGKYPENTMVAFEKAILAGCNGIETDVQLTKDGIAVLCHDESLDRTTDHCGFLKDYTLKELLCFDAGIKMGEEFKNERIPTLDELLNLAKDKRIMLNLELKNSIIEYRGMEELVIQKIYEYGLQDKVIVSSFNHYSMAKCKEIDPSIKTGLLYICNLYHPEKYCKMVGSDALHPHFYSLTKEIVEAAHENGLLVNTYTVNEESDMKKMIALGVDGMITNYPDLLRKYCI